MLCLSGFELYSRWVPLLNLSNDRLAYTPFSNTKDLSFLFQFLLVHLLCRIYHLS